MKRSGFKSPARERVRSYPSAISESQRRNATYARMDVPAAPPIEKESPVRSEAYRRLVASLPCISCHKLDRSQHAHENEGKGKSLKLDDRRAMPLCADEPDQEGCHTKFDHYRLVEGGREAHIEQGRSWSERTRDWVIDHDLWPANLERWTE